MPYELIFLIIALILFALAALNVSSPRVGLAPAGLFFLALSMLVAVV